MGVFTAIDPSELARFVAGYALGTGCRGAGGAPASGLSSESSSESSSAPPRDDLAFVGIPAGSVNSNFEVRIGAARYFLRVYEEQDAAGARREAELLSHLAARGVATAAPLAAVGGDADGRVGSLAGKPAALFPWRDGEMICQRGVTVAHARALGEALARVHDAGADAEVSLGGGRFGPREIAQRLDVVAGAEREDLRALAAPLREKLALVAGARDEGAERGIVHGDLFRDNVLWSPDGKISALLDFESASEGALAFDVAVTLLAWTFGDGFDLPLASAFVGGYLAARPLSERTRASLYEEARFACVRFATTRITDYAMRTAAGPRVVKDHRRFLARLAALEALGPTGFRDGLGL